MLSPNIHVQADSLSWINNALSNSTPKISTWDYEKVGRSLAYLFDSVSTIVTAVNPIIESLGILIDTTSSNSTTKSFLSRSGYVTDDNSTFVLKSMDANEIWIREKSAQLLSLLRAEDVESGIASPSEVFVKQALMDNRVLALQMINQVYLDNVGNAHIQIGILHLSSHIDYNVGNPTLQTIALAALSDNNDDVKDYAVQCYENWNHKDGLRILKTIYTETRWLQDYIDNVIIALSENFSGVSSIK